MMGSKSDETSCQSTSKESEGNEARDHIVIIVDNDDQMEISSENPDTSSLKAIESNDLLVGSAEMQEAKSIDKSVLNIESLDEIPSSESSPRFVRIGNKVLENRPSYVVRTVEDATTQNQKQMKGKNTQQLTSSSEISFKAGCQQDGMCSVKDMATNSNSYHNGNADPTIRKLLQPTVTPPVPNNLSPSSAKQTTFIGEKRKRAGAVYNFRPQAQVQPPVQQKQHQQCQSTSSHAPYFAISLVPMTQTRCRCGTSVIPCQQLLSAPSSNSMCSNCCLPRHPQVCQMPTTTKDCRQNLGCCLLTPYGYPNCCCSRFISCCSVSSPQHQPSLRFTGYCNTAGMPMSNQISRHSVLTVPSTTGFAVGGSYHPRISPCLCQLMPTWSQCSHCRMNIHHYPHCNCAGFFNNQFPQQGQQAQCDCRSGSCSLSQQPRYFPKKATGLDAIGEEGTNREGQPLSVDQEQEQEKDKNKSPTDAPRSLGGVAKTKGYSNSVSLYVARFGRTCLVLRPTAPAMWPRLLTKRISRYTSVVVSPKRIISGAIK